MEQITNKASGLNVCLSSHPGKLVSSKGVDDRRLFYMGIKMSISKTKRFEVFKRDGFQCQYCGRTPPKIILEADHVIPRSSGGRDDIENLVTSCFDCNRGKGKRDLKRLPKSTQKRMEEIRESESQLIAYYELQAEVRERIEIDVNYLEIRWFKLTEDKDHCFTQWTRLQLKNLLRQFTRFEIEDAMEITAAKRLRLHSFNKQFKYMCGVLWNKKRQRENGEDA